MEGWDIIKASKASLCVATSTLEKKYLIGVYNIDTCHCASCPLLKIIRVCELGEIMVDGPLQPSKTPKWLFFLVIDGRGGLKSWIIVKYIEKPQKTT